jgi:hypothetical protein
MDDMRMVGREKGGEERGEMSRMIRMVMRMVAGASEYTLDQSTTYYKSHPLPTHYPLPTTHYPPSFNTSDPVSPSTPAVLAVST